MKPIRVAFLGLYFEAWDALHGIYKLMLHDDRFEPFVVTMPRKLTGQSDYSGEEKAHIFFEKLGINHIRVNDPEDLSGELGLARIKELEPDYVFLNYPWQRNYQPNLRPDQLSQFARIAYVPYFSLVMVREHGAESEVATHLYRQRAHQLASLVFTQDQGVFEAFASTERGNSHVKFVGSPKIDALRLEAESGRASWPILGEGFRMVWAPHHSYSPHWYNFGVFAKVYRQMLGFATANPEIQIVLRPHPFLWGTLTDRNVLTNQELSQWRREWDELPNTHVDEDGSYAELFLATDILVTDGISFLGEYPLVTKKPTIFFENQEHWAFTHTGELAAESSIRVKTFEELESTIQLAKESGLPDRSAQINSLIEASSPHPGKSAQIILQAVLDDFAGPVGPSNLVDKALLQEIPWELEPGREPFED